MGNWKATIKSETYRVQILQARILQLKQAVCAMVEETGCVNKSTGGLRPIVHMQLQSYAGVALPRGPWGSETNSLRKPSKVSHRCVLNHISYRSMPLLKMEQAGGSCSGWRWDETSAAVWCWDFSSSHYKDGESTVNTQSGRCGCRRRCFFIHLFIPSSLFFSAAFSRLSCCISAGFNAEILT